MLSTILGQLMIAPFLICPIQLSNTDLAMPDENLKTGSPTTGVYADLCLVSILVPSEGVYL